jgi:hypothetical protein
MQNTENTENIENIEKDQQIDKVEPIQENVVEQTEQHTAQEEKPRTFDPEEYIIDTIWNSGKREVRTTDLISFGFDPSRIDAYEIIVGKYRLSRMIALSPYKLEKIAQ